MPGCRPSCYRREEHITQSWPTAPSEPGLTASNFLTAALTPSCAFSCECDLLLEPNVPIACVQIAAVPCPPPHPCDATWQASAFRATYHLTRHTLMCQ